MPHPDPIVVTVAQAKALYAPALSPERICKACAAHEFDCKWDGNRWLIYLPSFVEWCKEMFAEAK